MMAENCEEYSEDFLDAEMRENSLALILAVQAPLGSLNQQCLRYESCCQTKPTTQREDTLSLGGAEAEGWLIRSVWHIVDTWASICLVEP